VDNLSALDRQRTMRAVRAKDTQPEWIVRRIVHGLGYRYRLHGAALPGKPDMVFTARRKVIFIHGCFWHGHQCPAGLNRPRSNTPYWLPKLNRTVQRDAEHRKALAALGWRSLTLWECELRSGSLPRRIVRFLGPVG